MAGIALRQVRAVIAVCEEGSFTRAAERENGTQSGISQHVAAAERALGVKLFERTTTGVSPTPAGLRYYKRCVEAVGALDGGDMLRDARLGPVLALRRARERPFLAYRDDGADLSQRDPGH